MGWDAFGLPAEQHAIETGQHPARTTATNIATFKRPLEMLGFSDNSAGLIAESKPEPSLDGDRRPQPPPSVDRAMARAHTAATCGGDTFHVIAAWRTSDRVLV
jgi:hypothetical protein